MITSGRPPTVQILVLIGTVGASPHIGEILPLCDFFFWLSCPVLSCPVLFISGTRRGRTAEPIFTLYGSNDVFSPIEVPFGGQDDGWRHLGKICPQNSPKWAWIGNFKPKRTKHKNYNISESMNPIKTKFEDQHQTTIALRGWSNVIQIKSNMAAGRHLKKIDMTS